MTFWEHIEELRRTLLRAGAAIFLFSFAVFFFHQPLIKVLLAPLETLNLTLYLFGPVEGFSIAFKVSFWVGLLASSPFWVFTFLQFIFPGLRQKEKKVLIPFLLFSIFFIGAGIIFAYFITLPLVIHFFYQFNAGMGENLWGMRQTFDFALALILAHGIVFELYVGLLMMIHFKVIRHTQLKKGRRLAIVVILVIAALLTPPDILSQLLLAIPMWLLYEGSLAYAKTKREGVSSII